MITAAITAAVAAILAMFGIKPGPYLVFVAAGVKIVIVLLGLLLGAKVVRGRRERAAAPPEAGGSGNGGDGDGQAPVAAAPVPPGVPPAAAP